MECVLKTKGRHKSLSHGSRRLKTQIKMNRWIRKGLEETATTTTTATKIHRFNTIRSLLSLLFDSDPKKKEIDIFPLKCILSRFLFRFYFWRSFSLSPILVLPLFVSAWIDKKNTKIQTAYLELSLGSALMLSVLLFWNRARATL